MATPNAVETGHLTPRQPVPAFSIPTLDHGTWTLAEQTPENFSILFFYRGLHCPICRNQLRDLERNLDKFAELGINIIAISSDSEERARTSQQEWELSNLTIGYGLSLDTAREWGLFVSNSIKDSEPTQFSEPGMFIIRPNGELFASQIASMPFARALTKGLIGNLEWAIENDYPGRGEA